MWLVFGRNKDEQNIRKHSYVIGGNYNEMEEQKQEQLEVVAVGVVNVLLVVVQLELKEEVNIINMMDGNININPQKKVKIILLCSLFNLFIIDI